MDIFSNRPLFTSCMLFIACSVIGFFIPATPKLVLLIVSAIILIFSLILALVRFYSAKKKTVFLSIILCSIMASVSFGSSYLHFDTNLNSMESIYDKDVSVDATVVSEISQSNFTSKYQISVNGINGESNSHKAILECTYQAALQVGDKITVKATATSPESQEGRFDEKISLYSDGIFVIYTSEKEDHLDVTEYQSENSFSFSKLNNYLSTILLTNIEGDEGALSSALLLGNKSLLEDDIVRDFRRAGASHILALSGLHMSIIMGISMLIMKRLTQKRWLIAVILSAFALTYLGITGFSLSASRAVIMLLIVYYSMIISRIPDSLTSLSIAGALILLISPGAVVDAGFWMSFTATLGILVFLPPINNYFSKILTKYDDKFKRNIYKLIFSIIISVSTALAAIIPLIGVTCIFGRELSAYSVLSSLILSIPTTLIIFFSLLLLLFSSVPFVSGIIITVIRFMAKVMFDYCSYISSLEDIVISLNYPFAILMAIILSGALLYSFAVKRRNPFTALIPFAISLIVFASIIGIYEYQNKDTLKVSYINASSTSDMLVLSNERDVVLCDISNGSQTSYNLALDELYEARATEIKVIILTRYTNQHLASLETVFKTNRVREIWLPSPSNETQLDHMERIYDCAIENGVSVSVYNPGDALLLFEHTTLEHVSGYIERSVVPISLISIRTGSEYLTYCSPAFNESDISEEAEHHFSRSTHIIFGNRGPKSKSEYTIPDTLRLKSVTFADEIRAAYFVSPERSLASHYLADKEIEFYLEK